ncbi:MAG: acetolactate synthase small subunit, partial [Bacteroidales bacterium]|nr:acetolactate synthase small subunit [Bacteroidales bacterium]
MREEYTISIFTEDHIGIFNQITNIFTRRQINIDSITCSITAVPGVSLITLVVKTTHNMITTVAKQIERIIDVLKVFVHTSDQIIYQEIALFKVAANGFLEGNNVDQVVRNFSARII